MTRYRNFHPGEAKLQAEDGIDTLAYDQAVDESFQPELNDSEVRFVNGRTFSVAATIDEDGRPWASPLIGKAGQLFDVEDRTTIRVRPRTIAGDPLFENVKQNGSLGVLFFNPAIRRRAHCQAREQDFRLSVTHGAVAEIDFAYHATKRQQDHLPALLVDPEALAPPRRGG